MDYEPEHLKKWTSADPVSGTTGNYAGEDMSEYYVVMLTHRDADALTRSNWTCAEEILGESVHVHGCNNWAVGWVDWMLVHQDDTKGLKEADKIVAALADYPVLNDEHFSELECEEADKYWNQCSLKERIEMCRDAGVSVFAARHDYIPSDDSGAIFEQCREC